MTDYKIKIVEFIDHHIEDIFLTNATREIFLAIYQTLDQCNNYESTYYYLLTLHIKDQRKYIG